MLKVVIYFILSIGFPFAYASQDVPKLQACLSMEVAQVHQLMPPGSSTTEAYKLGYSTGFDFISQYENYIRSIPNYTEAFPKILIAALNAGSNMAAMIAKEKISSEVAKCRVVFSESQIDTRKESKQKNISQQYSIRVTSISASVNHTWKETGLFGLIELTQNCYAALTQRGLDCLIVDRAAMMISKAGPNPSVFEFFENSKFQARRQKFFGNPQFSANDVQLLESFLDDQLSTILIKNLSQSDRDTSQICIIHDPDISQNFSGECVDGRASGYGVGWGRDTYIGEFENGHPHGRGKYIWGNSSKWSGEEFDGWYYKGKRVGFGVGSVDASSKHPALLNFKKVGIQTADRIFVSALFSGAKPIILCKTESECLTKIPQIEYIEVRNLLMKNEGVIQPKDVIENTIASIDRVLNLPSPASLCIAKELYDNQMKVFTESPTSKDVAEYISAISDRKLLSRILGYCLPN